MKSSRPTPQTPAARREAEAELGDLVSRFAPAHESLVGAVRRWLRKRLPAAHEVVYEYTGFFVVSFSPDERGYEGVFAVRADADGVRLYFNRGKGLPDPAKRLRGTGKLVRYVEVESASTLADPAVARLVHEAVARHRVPFARAGRGQLVVRSTAARRRRPD